MKFQILFFLTLTFNSIFSQNIKEIENVEGIWIAEKFYNSFEKSKTILYPKSILNSNKIFNPRYPKVFNPNYPVALRINKTEIKNEILNIGYSTLHDHRLHPEVSEYTIIGKDTIKEQGSFKINLNKKDSLNFYSTSEIGFFNYENKSKIKFENDRIILLQPKIKGEDQEIINYVKISNNFTQDYQYPNPLYFYTRKHTLVGKYTLKDSTNNVLSNNLEIKPNGKVIGSPIFKGKYAHYSTDAFCGPPKIDEVVLFCDKIESDLDYNCVRFVYKRIDDKTIYLYKSYARNIFDRDEKLGEIKYKLIKH